MRRQSSSHSGTIAVLATFGFLAGCSSSVVPLATEEQIRQATEECAVSDWSYTTEYITLDGPSPHEGEPVLFFDTSFNMTDGISDSGIEQSAQAEQCLESALSALGVRANMTATFTENKPELELEGE